MKTALKAILALFLAPFGFVTADADGDYKQYFQNPINVYLTDPCTTYDGYYRALMLQPTSNSLSYGAEAYPQPAVSPHWRILEIRPDYNYSFEVGLGAVCHERNSKFKANWAHFSSKDSASKRVSETNFVGPFSEIGPDAAFYNTVKGRNTFHFDSVSLDYGVLVSFGCDLQTNLYGGITGATIKQVLTSKFSNTFLPVTRTIKTPSKFIGIGPQLGMDCTYSICDGFHMVGEAAASLLIGQLSNHTTFSSTAPELTTSPNVQSITIPHRVGVVPAFEGRLGFSYSWTLCGCYNIDLEAGYKASLYINAIQSTDMSSEVVTPPAIPGNGGLVSPSTLGVYARTFRRTLSNFALAGPYLSLNVKF